MSAAQPRPESATTAVPVPSLPPERGGIHLPPASPPRARLADELAVPAPSPVHELQAELVQLTALQEPIAEPAYPGWLRLGFPVATSLLLWAALLWGASRLA